MSRSFDDLAAQALSAAGLFERCASGKAIVLERIAAGGGRTCWYFVDRVDDLPSIISKLSPGSLVSFYFDARFKQASYESKTRAAIEQVWLEHREAVVAIRKPQAFELQVTYVSGYEELDDLETCGDLGPGIEVFVGAFPATDNDGEHAITLTLPDADGVVREHPY